MGYAVFLDDKQEILDTCGHLYSQSDLTLELKSFTNLNDFREFIKGNRENVRSLIFDLADSEEEADTLTFSSEVEENFSKFNVPIFIYSGHLEKYSRFKENGTVFKVDKDVSFKFIIDKIKVFEDSGFLDIFCPGGIIETEIHKDLNEAFTKQFKNNTDIENIINSLEGDDLKNRTKNVFRRIALRSLMSKLLAPETDENITVNASEHYLRRLSNFEIWTGDIFLKNDTSEMILILTPRCDLANNRIDKILVCSILEDNEIFSDTKGNKEKIIKKIRRALTNDPDISGNKFRFLPPTPLFRGGKVDLSTMRTIPAEGFLDDYKIQISLSEDLTNEILGKFASYFLRTGISTIDVDEMIKYIDMLKEEK